MMWLLVSLVVYAVSVYNLFFLTQALHAKLRLEGIDTIPCSFPVHLQSSFGNRWHQLEVMSSHACRSKRWVQHYISVNVAKLGRIMMDTQSEWVAEYEKAM